MTSFVCGTCSEEHEGLPFDYGFGLPDEVYALDYIQRYLRSRSNADVCTLDESRYFLRGVLPVPFTAKELTFGLGIWVEVPMSQHDLYVAGFHDDLSDNPAFVGHIANEIQGFGALNLPVEVRFRSGNDRPEFRFPPGADHLLAREQRLGITAQRHHEILEGFGYFTRA
jgi:hypothetical protein